MFDQIFDVEKIFSFFETIFHFFILNILFLFANIPLLVFFFCIGISQIGTYLPTFLICFLPLGPAFGALLHCMKHFLKYKDIRPIKEYKKGYKENFKQSVILSFFYTFALFVILTNIRFITTALGASYSILFWILLFILVGMFPNLYLLMVQYKMKCFDLIKLALACTIGKPIYTIANLVIFLFILTIFELVPGTTFLFIGSLYAFLLMFSNQKWLCAKNNTI